MLSPKDLLTQRVKEGLSKRLAEYPAIMRTRTLGEITPAKMRRIELLDLNKETDLERWQVLHNNPDKYEVLSEKESHQKTEYFVRIIYYELGDDLPDVKSKDELRVDDKPESC